MKDELEILNEIKNKLLVAGEVVASPKYYTLYISVDDWHKIFKTDEYNEKHKS